MVFGLVLAPVAWAQSDTLVFSAPGGFYDDVFALEMQCGNPDNHIRYTTNGNRPTAQSQVYEHALTMDEAMFSTSNIHTIVNTIPSMYYQPEDVQRAIVVRAAVFDADGNCVSQVVTNSYFIRALGCDFHGLPVLSIVTDSLSLFDYETGIFVPGALYDPADSTHTGNYYQKGDEWERPINFEFYDPDNSGINQQCGLRMHGGASRWYQQKGMKLYAREEYGKKHFLHRFFKDSHIVKFKHLNLHPFRCSNWLQMGGTDFISQKVASQLNIDAMAVRETVVFINGEYWGIYTLEEAADEHYLKDHYNADLDSVTIIKYWGVPNYGDPTEWRDFLYSFLMNADLTQPEDSAYAYQHIDVPGFIDYILLEVFSANRDWPNNNVKISQMAPGKPFRMMFYDGDGCFSKVDYPAFNNAISQEHNSMVLNRFLENRGFRFGFFSRYLELLETYFSYDYLKSVLDDYSQLVEGEVDAQSRRFGFPWNVNKWHADMEKADEFIRQRRRYFDEEIEDYLDVAEQAPMTVSCYPNPSSGEIHLHIDTQSFGGGEVAIYDLPGRKVFAQPVGDRGSEEIVIHPNLPAGIYVLKTGCHAQKIVIQ